MNISSITFKNFKTFRDEETFGDTKKINFLIGPNGVGKTNVLTGINKINDLFKGTNSLQDSDCFDKNGKEMFLSITFNLSDKERTQIADSMKLNAASYAHLEDFLRNIKYSVWCNANQKVKDSILISINSDEFQDYMTIMHDGNKTSLAVTPLKIVGGTASKGTVVIYNESNMMSRMNKINKPLSMLFEKVFDSIAHVHNQRMSIESITPAEKIDISMDGSQLSNEINTMSQKKRTKHKRYEQSVKQIAPHISQINAPLAQNHITIEIREDGLKNEITHRELSDGYHQSLIIPHVIQNSDSHIFFLVEPELHLHAQSQKALLAIIRNNPRHQFFIETHSPVFTGFDDSEATFLISKSHGASNVLAISKDNIAQIKHELGLAHSDIYEHDHVCFVEGESEREAFSIIAQKAKQDLGYKSMLWTLGGYGNLKNIKTLFQYLKITHQKIFVILDENNEASEVIRRLTKQKILNENNVYMLDKSFEDQFSSHDIITSMHEIAQQNGFAFKLSESELAERRKHEPVDKILCKILHNNFNLSKPELARKLAHKLDSGKLNENAFAKIILKVLSNNA